MAATGFNPFLAALMAIPLLFGLGYGLQRLLLNHTLGDDILPPLLVTFGLSIIIENGLLEAVLGRQPPPLGRSCRDGLAVPRRRRRRRHHAASDPCVRRFVILALNLLFYRTALGRAFRATSDDPEIAKLMGIDHRRIFPIAMGVAMVVATVAALYLGVRANFDPTIGPSRLIYAFEAVIIGGLGSLWGTLAGGIIIGVAQAIGAHIDPEWQILAGHLAFLVVLMLRPRGLFPRAVD